MVKEEGSDLEAAKKAGVKFIRFPDDRYPAHEKTNGNLAVHVYDILLGKEFTMPADLLVLTTGYKGNDTVEAIKGHLKVSANQDGFFQEAHIKLGPLDFPSDGISLWLCAISKESEGYAGRGHGSSHEGIDSYEARFSGGRGNRGGYQSRSL